MAGWHHWCNGHELGQTPEDGDGQGGLECCTPGVAKSRTWLGAGTTYVSYILIRLGEGKNEVQLFSKPSQGVLDKFLCASLVSSSILTPPPSHVLSSKNALFSSLYPFAHLVNSAHAFFSLPTIANSWSSFTRYILWEVLAAAPRLPCPQHCTVRAVLPGFLLHNSLMPGFPSSSFVQSDQ